MTEPNTPRRSFRLFSLEGLLAAFGLYSLGSGIYDGELMPAFWGVTILTGLLALTAVRRKNWQAHWEELERRNAAGPANDRQPPENPPS